MLAFLKHYNSSWRYKITFNFRSNIGCAFQKLRNELPKGWNDLSAIHCDLLKEEDFIRLFMEIKKFGHVDVLVNNAAWCGTGFVIEGSTKAEWQRMLNVCIIDYEPWACQCGVFTFAQFPIANTLTALCIRLSVIAGTMYTPKATRLMRKNM
ncbi:hypothetical protein RvY_06790 [Ramazzottius varieornatus]|uniref:Uncharacterized protein n=1 Tax=Ramazzottius varieornatus TaxID=947166 RepID=A0A1D1V352_RAMVA|nr:hypothetical protein RvY_06790 [Ramazzottius varieornatus]